MTNRPMIMPAKFALKTFAPLIALLAFAAAFADARPARAEITIDITRGNVEP